MFETEEKIRKSIITPDGEDEFQIRYIFDENAGLLTARSEKSYLILDSIDYWYDCIQNKYHKEIHGVIVVNKESGQKELF